MPRLYCLIPVLESQVVRSEIMYVKDLTLIGPKFVLIFFPQFFTCYGYKTANDSFSLLCKEVDVFVLVWFFKDLFI